MFKTLLRSVIIACVCFCASQVLGYSYSMYPYELPSGKKGAALGCVRAERGMKLEPGKWYTNFEVCKEYADENGIPLMAIWSNNSCIHCWFTDVVFIQDQFIQWQQTSNAGKVIYCFMAGGDDDIDQMYSKAYNWMWKDGGVKLNEFPFVVMWWKKENVNVRLVGDVICRGNATSDLGLNSPTIPTRVDNVIAAMEKAFEGWKWNDGGQYTGGMFELEESDGHRLEAEAAKRPVIVELIRKSEVIDIATNNVIDVVDASGSIVSTTNVVWAAGQEMQEVSIDISNLEFSEDGEKAFLFVKDADGTVVGTNRITYVDKPNSAANPLWIGERAITNLISSVTVENAYDYVKTNVVVTLANYSNDSLSSTSQQPTEWTNAVYEAVNSNFEISDDNLNNIAKYILNVGADECVTNRWIQDKTPATDGRTLIDIVVDTKSLYFGKKNETPSVVTNELPALITETSVSTNAYAGGSVVLGDKYVLVDEDPTCTTNKLDDCKDTRVAYKLDGIETNELDVAQIDWSRFTSYEQIVTNIVYSEEVTSVLSRVYEVTTNVVVTGTNDVVTGTNVVVLGTNVVVETTIFTNCYNVVESSGWTRHTETNRTVTINVTDETFEYIKIDKPELKFGEWTMDYEVATQRVAKAEGEAYTLVAVQGSLWCPDCENTKRNFLSVTNEFGNNYFSEWAKSNQVAFVTVDIPNFTTNSVVCESPTLLSRKAYLTSLARAKEVGVSGATIDMVDKSLHSGLGYLTRKGVSDEEALAVLERNRIFVQTDTSAGGFHCPADRSSYRTGAPIFVLLRKDGSVAARMTTFASKSPMTADREKIEDILKRFDELLAIADAEGIHFDDIKNDYPGDRAIEFSGNGGEASGEISHCDFTDVFKLLGFNGNALLKVTVKGETDGEVKVTFCKLNSEGKREYIGNGATGILSEGVSLEYTFTEAGEYFVEVSGVSINSESFSVDSKVEWNFHPFTISGDVVFVPQQESATGKAPEKLDTIVLRLEKDKVYRLQGVNIAKVNKAELEPFNDEPNCLFFTAKVDGDVSVPLFYGDGASLVYQMWEPGTVGFDSVSMSMKEDAGSITVPLSRADGKSGRVAVRVTLDEEKTDLYYSEDEPRFSFSPDYIVWEEGENHKTNVVIDIIQDSRFDGSGNVVLKLEVVEDVNGDTKVVNDTFTLSVKEDDIQAAGKVAFVGAEPFYSKKLTVYVREGERATIYAKRLEASDGPVSVGVKSSLAGVEISGDVSDGELQWGNHKYEDKSVVVKGVPAGKTATITLYNAMDGLKILSASNNVRVVGVAADAPWFVNDTASANLYRYVASSNSYSVAVADGAEFTKMTFTKLSGTLPAGLKVAWDEASNALVLSGVVTAKAGVYNPVYQVVLVNGSERVPGLTLELTIKVTDPTASAAGEDGELVDSVFKKARTFKDIPVVSQDGKLKGLIQVTIPPAGRVSAKYVSENGTASFSATSWESCDVDASGKVNILKACLKSRAFDGCMTVKAFADGSIKIELCDGDSDEVYTAEHSGIQWSRENSAASWKGYYTVVLPVETVDESHDGLAPSGAGYITLKMNTTSAVNSGKVTWAGMLPNGTAVSGSSVLGSVVIKNDTDNEDQEWVRLPVFKYSSTDVVAIGARILANSGEMENPRSVESDDGVYSRWEHKERDAAFNAWYKVGLGVYGGLYRTKDAEGKDFDLAACCTEYYETVNPVLAFYSSMLDEAGDGFLVLDPVATAVGAKTLTFADKKAVPSGMTMSLNRTTGVVSGAFELSLTDADGSTTVSANWKGVVVQGWGPGCGCAPGEDGKKYLPFVCGAYYYTDHIATEDGTKTTSVKCGGVVTIGKP